MNDLIKVSYENDRPTVLARELHEFLDKKDCFADFFIAVCELKVGMSFDELGVLNRVLDKFVQKFGNAVIYLKDCVQTERVIPLKLSPCRQTPEETMRNKVLDNFEKIFPDYTFVQTERPVDGVGRIDIYGECAKRPVIIELKAGRKNPNPQLLAYGSRFYNPILIGITENQLSENQKNKNILYLSMDDIESLLSVSKS